MKSFVVSDVLQQFKNNIVVIVEYDGKSVKNAKPVHEENEDSIVWFNPSGTKKVELFKTTKAWVIVADDSLSKMVLESDKCLIVA